MPQRARPALPVKTASASNHADYSTNAKRFCASGIHSILPCFCGHLHINTLASVFIFNSTGTMRMRWRFVDILIGALEDGVHVYPAKIGIINAQLTVPGPAAIAQYPAFERHVL